MRHAFIIALWCFGPVLASGCTVVEKHTQAISGRPSCRPSQYWDGSQCRHKGQGHGARKHDGAAPAGKSKKR